MHYEHGDKASKVLAHQLRHESTDPKLLMNNLNNSTPL